MKKYKQAFKVGFSTFSMKNKIKIILKITTSKWRLKPFLDDDIIYKIEINKKLFP